MKKNCGFNRLIIFTGMMLVLSTTASAYIDAGTGSVVTQVVIAGALGAIFTLKSFWGNLKRILNRRNSK